MAKKILVTIGREFGSGGHEIGKRLSQILNVDFYDKELLELAAKQSGIHENLFEINDERPINSLLYTLSVSHSITGETELPLDQRIFLAIYHTIQNLAQKGSGVFVGRCADYALQDYEKCLNIFIHAPLQKRIHRIKPLYELSSNEAKNLIVKTDKKRASFYHFYADRKWGDLQNYHMTIDSGILGIEGTAQLLASFVTKHQEETLLI